MVEASRNMYRAMKGYWNRRKGYHKLNGSGRSHPSVEVMGGCKKRRFRWRIRLNRKLKLSFRFSPKKLLIGFRDGYINFMNRIANSSMVAAGGGFAGSGALGYGANAVNGFGVRTLKEYDEKMIVDLYKSLVIAQAQLLPCGDIAKYGTPVLCSSKQ